MTSHPTHPLWPLPLPPKTEQAACGLDGGRGPIRARTHGKRLKKIQESVGKSSQSPTSRSRALATNTYRCFCLVLFFKEEKYTRNCSELYIFSCVSPPSIKRRGQRVVNPLLLTRPRDDDTLQERTGLRSFCRGQEQGGFTCV